MYKNCFSETNENKLIYPVDEDYCNKFSKVLEMFMWQMDSGHQNNVRMIRSSKTQLKEFLLPPVSSSYLESKLCSIFVTRNKNSL